MPILIDVCRYASLRIVMAAIALAALPAFAQTAPRGDLKITILDGDNAMNNIRLRTAREPVVQVEDENHNRVPGAVVVFTLPARGPGGTFLNGVSTLTVTTDAQGRAVARGLHPNSLSGDFDIRVNASYQDKTARAVVHQHNMVPKPTGIGLSAKWIGAIAGVGAGAAAGVVAATRSHGTAAGPVGTPGSVTPAVSGISISAGAGSVGPPR